MITIQSMQCEASTNPFGVEVRHPRLSWVLQAAARGQAQTAVQILAASSVDLLNERDADLWDSGKVLSAHPMLGYAGYPLASRQRCYWTVRVWDGQDQPGPFSAPAWFEMGLLRPADWQARWIGAPDISNDGALYYLKDFVLSGELRQARMYVSGTSAFQVYLNGEKTGPSAPDPAPVRPDLLIPYRVEDLTAQLQQGENHLRVRMESSRAVEKKLLLQLEVIDLAGRVETIATGAAEAAPWRARMGSAVEEDDSPREISASEAQVAAAPGGRMYARMQPAAGVVSQFHSSSAVLNRIHARAVESERSLAADPPFGGAPEERLRWLQAMLVRAEAPLFNFDEQLVYAEWMEHLIAGQDPLSRALSGSAPGVQASAAELAGALVPWMIFIHYGDGRTLARHYLALRDWVDALARRAEDHLLPGTRAESALDEPRAYWTETERRERLALISTALYHRAHWLIYEFAGVIGNMQDKEDYVTVADQIAEAFHRRFWNAARHGYGQGDQTANALALYFDLVPPEVKAAVVDSLVQEVARHGMRLTTGVFGAYCLMDALADAGRADVVYPILTQPDFLENAPVELIEAADAWCLKYAAGVIPDLHYPAYEQFFVRPRLTAQLDSAELTLQTRCGEVHAAWQRRDEAVAVQVTVPVGSRAIVSLPRPGSQADALILEAGRMIWQNGPAAGLPAEFLSITAEDQWIHVTVGSGSYAFVCRQTGSS